MNELIIWAGIVFCITQSAMFSGLNLAFFSLTRRRLEIEAENDTSFGATTVLALRKDSNFLLTTILWDNVGINVLLTLLSDSVMAGIYSFTFSTVVITFFGEIIPQAYFSRNALRMASLFSPVLRVYQFLLYPVAKPSALLLDTWLGKEAVQFFSEENVKMFIKKHIEGKTSEIDLVEGTGAINFFSMDDQRIIEEGEQVNPQSIIELESADGEVVIPEYRNDPSDPFIRSIDRSGEKWIIFTNSAGEPKLALDADGFLRSIVFGQSAEDIQAHFHEPVVLTEPDTRIGRLIKKMRENFEPDSDEPIKVDVVLYWTKDDKRIITGADILVAC